MGERIEKDELARRLAERMHADPATAAAWIDGLVETLYASFKNGESVTLRGFGSFCFNPGQRLRGLFGWSSTYKGKP